MASQGELESKSKVIVRSLGWNAVFAGMWAVGAFVCLGNLGNVSGLAARILLVVVGAGCVFMAYRAVVAGAEAGPGGVNVRGFFRTRLVPWAAIVEIGPSYRGGASCVGLRLGSGQIVQVRGCGAYSNRTLRKYAEALSGARPADAPAPVPERQAEVEPSSQTQRMGVRQWWFLVGLPLLAVPVGVAFVVGFSFWPGIALAIGGVAVATMNYRRLRSHQGPKDG